VNNLSYKILILWDRQNKIDPHVASTPKGNSWGMRPVCGLRNSGRIGWLAIERIAMSRCVISAHTCIPSLQAS